MVRDYVTALTVASCRLASQVDVIRQEDKEKEVKWRIYSQCELPCSSQRPSQSETEKNGKAHQEEPNIRLRKAVFRGIEE